MGCNCKNGINNLLKYSDDGIFEERKSLLVKMLQFIMQIGFGILSSIIIIIMIIPFLTYIIVCLLFGLSPTVRLYNFNKKKKNNE